MKDLFNAIKHGTPRERNEALKILYFSKKVRGKIAGYLKHWHLDNSELEEFIQMGVIKTDEKIRNGDFRGDSAVETFLISVCKWMIWDHVKKIRKTTVVEIAPDSAEEKQHFLYDQFAQQELTEAEKQRDAVLHEIIDQMDEKCRKAMTLFYLEEKSAAKVAEARGLSSAAQARKALDRCRKKLQAVLAKNPSLIKILKPKS